MRTTEANQLQCLRTVQLFLDRHRHTLPAIATCGARRRLDATLASLERHVTDQAGSELGARGYTQRYRALRRRLIRAHMAPIALVARAAEPPVPALDPFRLPRGKPTAHILAAMARGMAEAAAPHAATFISAGLPDDFAEQLVHAANAMLDAIDAREKELARRRGATEGLRTRLSAGRRIVRVLDAFMRAEGEPHAGLLADWQSTMHVRRTGRRTAVGEDTATVAEAAMAPAVESRRAAALGGRMLAMLARSERVA